MTISKKPRFRSRYIFFIAFFCVCVIWNAIGLVIAYYNHTGPFGFSNTGPMQIYSFGDHGLSLDFPKSWRILLAPNGDHGDMAIMAVITIPWHSLPNITIAHEPGDGDIISVARWGESRAMQFSSFRSINLTTFDSEYFPAMQREYTGTIVTPFSITSIRCLDYYVLYDKTGYTFSFCADQHDWSKIIGTFSEIIASIKPSE